MRDICTETLVAVVPTAKDRVLKFFLIALVAVSVIAVMLFGLIGIVVPALSIWLLLRQLRKTDAEYEYVHTNDVFDVDVVIRNSRRKQLFTVDLAQVALIAPADSDEVRACGKIKTTDYSGSAAGAVLYAMICAKGGKQQKLLLSLDEPMRRSLKQWIPDKVL